MTTSYYVSEIAQSDECATYNDLRKKGKFFDVTIVTKDQSTIDAHRFVLVRRFPRIENDLPDSANSQLLWSRFEMDIVKEVLSYAYTGKICIKKNYAIRLYLLSTHLHCDEITRWCINFLKTEIDESNVIEAWPASNFNMEQELIEACLPSIRNCYEELIKNHYFWSNTLPIGMASILTDPQLNWEKYEGENKKVLALTTWLDSQVKSDVPLRSFEASDESKSNGRNQEILALFNWADLQAECVEHSLEQIMPFLNLGSLSTEVLSFLYAKFVEFNGSQFYRNLILSLLSSNRDDSIQNNREIIVRCRSNDEKVPEWIISNVSELQKTTNCQFKYPFADNSVIYCNNVWGFILNASREFIVWNLEDGRIRKRNHEFSTLQTLTYTGSDRLFFVFGKFLSGYGYSKSRVFSTRSFRWRELPDMLTERIGGSAVSIPGFGVLVLGGTNRDNLWLSKVELLCGNVDGWGKQNWKWESITPLLKPRYRPGVAYFDGKVFVAAFDDESRGIEVEYMQISEGGFKKFQWSKLSVFPGQSSPKLFAIYHSLILINGCKVFELWNKKKEDPDKPEVEWKQLCILKGQADEEYFCCKIKSSK